MGKLYVNRAGTLVIEVQARPNGSVTFFPDGGGFLRTMDESDFEQEFTETSYPSVLYPFKFTGDWLESDYPGYTNGRRWNGWAMPLVTRETLDALIAIMGPANAEMGDEGYRFRWDGNVMQVYDPQEEAEFAIHPTVEATTEGEKTLYDIALGWCWEFVTPSQPDQSEG